MATSRNPYATGGSPNVRQGATRRVVPDGMARVRNPGNNRVIPDDPLANDVTGVDPWETDTRPNLFWSDYAPALNWEIDFDAISGIPNMDDFSSDATRVEQATFDRAKGLLDPVFDQREIDMNEAMANRGLPAGSAVNTINRDQFGRDMGGAYEQAALDSVFAGRQEQGRLFGQALSSHGAGLNDQLTQMGVSNQARQQAWNEQMGARGQLFQELMGQLGTSDFDPNSYLTQGGFDPSNFMQAILGQNGQNTQDSNFWSTIGGAIGGFDWESIFGGGSDGTSDATIPVGQDPY